MRGPITPDQFAQELFDDLPLKLIKERVKRMIGRNGFTPSDREDLVQEFSLHLFERLQRLKESLANRKAFFRWLISRHAITLIRRRQTESRDHRRESSLSRMMTDSDGERVELARTIPEGHVQSRLGLAPADRAEELDQTKDVAAVLAKLPVRLRELCELLKVHSVSELARQRGVSRRTLREAITELRCRFKEAGLGENLGKSPATSPRQRVL